MKHTDQIQPKQRSGGLGAAAPRKKLGFSCTQCGIYKWETFTRNPSVPPKNLPIHPLRKCTGKMKGNVNVIGIKAGVWGRQPPGKIWGLSCLQRGIDKWENVAQRASHVSQKAPHPTSPIPVELGGPPAPPAFEEGPPED